VSEGTELSHLSPDVIPKLSGRYSVCFLSPGLKKEFWKRLGEINKRGRDNVDMLNYGTEKEETGYFSVNHFIYLLKLISLLSHYTCPSIDVTELYFVIFSLFHSPLSNFFPSLFIRVLPSICLPIHP